MIEMSAGERRNAAGEEHYKRMFDLATLFFFYLALLPLWALVWSLVPLLIFLEDGGPVFYRQKRLGRHGRPFRIVKFRTMVVGAEDLGPPFTEADDRRVTRVGRFLRARHLDEAPQAWNILRGEMSIVGPRPLLAWDYEHDDWGASEASRRLAVLPGITGLAQVRGRTWVTGRDKLRYDLLYIRRMGPWLDLKLIAMSLPIVLWGGGRRAESGLPLAPPDAEGGDPAPERRVPSERAE